MQLLHPAWLLALWPLPFFGAAAALARRRRARRLALLGPRAAATARRGDRRFAVQLSLCLAGFAFAAFALARPWWGQRDEETFVSSRNVIVLLDVSRSMLARDVRPSRLGRAKADLSDLARDLDGDRACLVAFRANAQTLCPFTADTGFFLEALDAAGPDSAARGETDLGGALSAALALLRDRGGDHNAILLVSDGEDLSGTALAAAKQCGEAHIPVFCVGVGGAAGAAIPLDDGGGNLRHDGEEVATRLDADTLKAVAEASGGVYLPLASTSSGNRTLGSIYKRHVRELVESDARAESERRRVERYGVFLLPALLLWMTAAALSPGRPMRRRAVKAAAPAAAAFAVFLSAATASGAETARDLAREAQRLFREGKAEEAAARYDAALAAKGGASKALEEDIRLNAAIATLEAGDAAGAAERFRALPPGFEASSGLGTALYRVATAPAREDETNRVAFARARLTAMQGAADAFAEAARLRPRDAAARTNLATAASAIVPLRKTLRDAEFEEKWGGRQPPEVLAALLAAQREAYAVAARAEADKTPGSIRRRETAAARQREAASAWKPLQDALVAMVRESVTNTADAAAFEARLSDAATAASDAADALDSFLPDALPAMRRAEETAFSLQPVFADPLALLSLAIESESNALVRVADSARLRTPVEEQQASSWLFQAFSDKIGPFLDKLDEEAEKKAAAAENAAKDAAKDAAKPRSGPSPDAAGGAAPPPDAEGRGSEALSDKIREEIRRLCSETSGTYSLVAMGLSPTLQILPDDQLPNARQIAVNLDELRKLLSPPRQQQNTQQQQQNSQQGESQNSQQGESQDSQQGESQDSQQGESQDSQQGEPQDESDAGHKDEPSGDEERSQGAEAGEEEPSDAEEQKVREAEESDEEPDPDDERAASLMQRVLDQEKRRAEAKRARRHTLPPKSGERDW